MLDAFLETVAGRTKKAEAQQHLEGLLAKLPTEVLHKIASGQILKAAYGPSDNDGICWLDKFRDTPQFEAALAIEKEELDLQMQEADRRQKEQALRASLPTWDETDMQRDQLRIKRKLLELEMAGGTPEIGGQEGEDIAAGPPPALPEAVMAEEAPPPPKPPTEKVTKETTEKPTPEKVDIKTAAIAMRMTLAETLRKEAQPAEGSVDFRR